MFPQNWRTWAGLDERLILNEEHRFVRFVELHRHHLKVSVSRANARCLPFAENDNLVKSEWIETETSDLPFVSRNWSWSDTEESNGHNAFDSHVRNHNQVCTCQQIFDLYSSCPQL